MTRSSTPRQHINTGIIRADMLRRAMIVTIPVAAAFAGMDITLGMLELGIVEALTAMVMIGLLLATIKRPEKVDWIAQMVVVCTATIFLTVLMTGGFTNNGFIWSVGFPFVACFLLGAKRGGIWILAYAVAMALIMLIDWQYYHVQSYTLSVAAYIGVTYIVFSFLAYFINSAQEKSMRENLRLRAAIEQVSNAISITDKDDKLIFTNAACHGFYGTKDGSMPGEPAIALHADDIDEHLNQQIHDTLQRGATWTGEVDIQTLQGKRTMQRIVSPVFDAGELQYHVCMDHDITHERQQQKQLEHSQRLESLGILAGGIAHDFNNILTAIMGNAALASMKLPDTSPAKELLSRIELSTQRASDLCKQMLAYSGKGMFIIKAIDLSKLVKEMTRLMEVSINKNISLNYHLSENLPCVEADAAQMQQVILNLITNANEAIGQNKGMITFSSGVIDVDALYLASTLPSVNLDSGRYVFVEVSDTGCGMDAATIDKIFDPFFTTKFTGRGLGMSAVLGIVRGHHGALKVYSEVGKGTTFKMLLPALPDHHISDDKNEPAPYTAMHGTVLVVDDEADIRELAAIMLAEAGLKTLMAADGLEAVELYQQHQHDIHAVLMDMTMPNMDGVACFAALRRINPDIKVILSSGYNEHEATSRFTGKGLAGFIQKPYSPDQLMHLFQQVIND
ncbi:MAG: response regulator [Mariprofundus sp.]|nr:response regulator [Mariprofundus sp.]